MAEPRVDRGDRVSLRGLHPEDAVRALLKVDPDSEPAEPETDNKGQDENDAPTK